VSFVEPDAIGVEAIGEADGLQDVVLGLVGEAHDVRGERLDPEPLAPLDDMLVFVERSGLSALLHRAPFVDPTLDSTKDYEMLRAVLCAILLRISQLE
jgi:hypothetical protein